MVELTVIKAWTIEYETKAFAINNEKARHFLLNTYLNSKRSRSAQDGRHREWPCGNFPFELCLVQAWWDSKAPVSKWLELKYNEQNRVQTHVGCSKFDSALKNTVLWSSNKIPWTFIFLGVQKALGSSSLISKRADACLVIHSMT